MNLTLARRATMLAVLVLTLTLAGCAESQVPEATPPSTAQSPSYGAPTSSVTAAPPTVAPAWAVPSDCRAILDEAVLSALYSIPLNDPAFGPSGVMPDGSLRCVWAEPGADTTSLTTTITTTPPADAAALMDELSGTPGYACYPSSGGTRCEAAWPNANYPVTDGRTVFWREGILIDTRYSNLAPEGYTASIVTHIFG